MKFTIVRIDLRPSSKLKKKVQQATFAENLVMNLARCDPNEFVAGKVRGMRYGPNEYLAYQPIPTVGPFSVAFATWGRVRHKSTLLSGSRMGTSDYATRTINVAPLSIEWDRTVSVAQGVFGLSGMQVVSFKGGISFQTSIEKWSKSLVYMTLWNN